MRNFDLAPLYRATVGFDQIADMMDRVLSSDMGQPTYPPSPSPLPPSPGASKIENRREQLRPQQLYGKLSASTPQIPTPPSFPPPLPPRIPGASKIKR